MGSRLFLIRDDNLITCINYGQQLYNVDAMHDDGGSDFDSIASPTKVNLSQVFSDTIGLGGSVYHNDILVNQNSTSEVDHYEFSVEESDGWSSEDGENGGIADESTTGSDDTCSVGTVIRYNINVHPQHEAPTRNEETLDFTQNLAPMMSNEDAHVNSYGATLQSDISSLVSSQSVVSNSKGTADWTCELARMRLGTESLFSFLNILEIQDNGNATKKSVVTAFLKMVDLERERRGEILLPSVCTAYHVLSSQIMPHTVILGTTTVAALLKELRFNRDDEIRIGEIYGAWDRLSREEMRLQDMASNGIMGALGRALGKIPSL